MASKRWPRRGAKCANLLESFRKSIKSEALFCANSFATISAIYGEPKMVRFT